MEDTTDIKTSVFAKSGYPKALVKRFADTVIQHIEALPAAYYKGMREFTENGNTLPPGDASRHALGFDFADDYKKMLAPAELVDKYTSLDSTTLEFLLSGYDEKPETVGLIDGFPVLFLRAPGQYLFEGGDTNAVITLALTGAFYPPVMPNKGDEYEKGKSS